MHQALNGKWKSSWITESLGVDIDTGRKGIEYQLKPEMSWLNIKLTILSLFVYLM